jgi:pentapeptide MXKDX repeat protein
MKKTLCRLMAMCFLAVPLSALAQSGDNMKQDQTQPDQMKNDNVKHDQMMKGNMKNDTRPKKTEKKTKKADMKKDDNMKQN